MDVKSLRFHLALRSDPTLLGADEDLALTTLSCLRFRWEDVPGPYGDDVSFAVGYVAGKEGLSLEGTEAQSRSTLDFEEGYLRGVRVREGKAPPTFDRTPALN